MDYKNIYKYEVFEIKYLTRHPVFSSILYLVSARASLQIVWSLKGNPESTNQHIVDLHLKSAPLIAALSYGYSHLLPTERDSGWLIFEQDSIEDVGKGICLGSGAFLIYLGAMASQNWVSAPRWGWETTSRPAVIRSIAWWLVGHTAITLNEELIFRGCGFAGLEKAIGPTSAAIVLTMLFGVYHGPDMQTVLGQTALGVALMSLRLSSGGMALPLGFHFGWNVIQTAIFGAADAEPSVRPLVVSGPTRWTGRPGHPEPGVLSALVNLGVAIGVGLTWWLRRRRSR